MSAMAVTRDDLVQPIFAISARDLGLREISIEGSNTWLKGV